nr:PA2169 family four-helix-bundle protein [Clostridium sporogenes]
MKTALKEDKKQMDKFLKGVHMGGSTFKDYLEKAQNVDLKNELKNIIESFKRHEEAITNRIEQMGGDAPDTLGF